MNANGRRLMQADNMHFNNSELGFSQCKFAEAPTVYEPGLLAGKRVIVSCSESEFGRATAWLFGRLGANVNIVSSASDAIEVDVEQMKNVGIEAACYAVDIHNQSAVDRLFNELWWRDGPVDILVNSVENNSSLQTKSTKAQAIDPLNGVSFMMQAATRQWADEGVHGKVINVVMATKSYAAKRAISAADDAKVIGALKSVTKQCTAPNLRVNSIAPRFFLAWEVAEAAAYLASEASGSLNGEVFTLEGDESLWQRL